VGSAGAAPLGRAGAKKLQYMRLGKGTSQHVLISGKTGSGKSTLLNATITNLALHYSPDELQFYLIDFKKGVEFKAYAAQRLPHARVIAIESEREFGMSVLERLFAIWRVDPVPIRYACTVRLSRALCPDAPSHRLPDVCAHLRLPRFAHHDAADDAKACARICLELARLSGADSLDALMAAARVPWKAIPSHSIQATASTRKTAPLTDGFEKSRDGAPFPDVFGEAGRASKSFPENRAERRRAPSRGAESPAACGPVFEGMCFVFTGELDAMERAAAEEAVQNRAGTVLGGVSRKVSVLVVGAQNPAIVRGAYSTKHQRALELRRTGHPIEIIDEAAFLLWLKRGLPESLRR
jgi:energy-coupling factor transporter ATP-binding protein EcfA2